MIPPKKMQQKTSFQKKHRAELLIPAGSLERLKTAFLYGADAVFCGTPDMSLRTKSEFSLDEIIEGIAFARALKKRVYLTLNLFSHNSDIEKLPRYLNTIRAVKPDGLIISDPGIFQYVKDHAPELEIHISTQASVCSWLTVDYWRKQGASLIVLARELSFEELSEIREKCPDIRLETFVHGSMCMTYSGRCLLSNYMAERRSNTGNCAHSCRWNYTLRIRLKDGSIHDLSINENNKEIFEFLLEEEFRPGQLFPIEEDEHGSYILNSKDLCLMPHLNEYLSLGIDSLKVEGRNKSNYYVGIVAYAYRAAIDDYYLDPKSWKSDPYMEILDCVSNRGYTLAFHNGRLSNLAHNYSGSRSLSCHEFAGHIFEWQGDDMIFEIRNEILPGDLIEFLPPQRSSFESPPDKSVFVRMRLQEFVDAQSGEITEKVSAGQSKKIRIPVSIFHGLPQDRIKEILPPLTLARKKKLFSSEECSRETSKKLPVRTRPRMGSEGCCGKGCNGCLIYWDKVKKEFFRTSLAP